MNREDSTSVAPQAPRRRDAEGRLLDVVGRITDRDRTICRLLDEHRVLTTSQVTDIGLSGERRTRMRLSELYGSAVVDRLSMSPTPRTPSATSVPRSPPRHGPRGCLSDGRLSRRRR